MNSITLGNAVFDYIVCVRACACLHYLGFCCHGRCNRTIDHVSTLTLYNSRSITLTLSPSLATGSKSLGWRQDFPWLARTCWNYRCSCSGVVLSVVGQKHFGDGLGGWNSDDASLTDFVLLTSSSIQMCLAWQRETFRSEVVVFLTTVFPRTFCCCSITSLSELISPGRPATVSFFTWLWSEPARGSYTVTYTMRVLSLYVSSKWFRPLFLLLIEELRNNNANFSNLTGLRLIWIALFCPPLYTQKSCETGKHVGRTAAVYCCNY